MRFRFDDFGRMQSEPIGPISAGEPSIFQNTNLRCWRQLQGFGRMHGFVAAPFISNFKLTVIRLEMISLENQCIARPYVSCAKSTVKNI
jgi:hypothetical protein